LFRQHRPPHAVSAFAGNSYSYDADGNQTTRVIGGQTYTLGYDAEGRLATVSGPSTSAVFTYACPESVEGTAMARW
jgi:YD repeat-containing protein